ncbi:MAG TPA: phosphatase PAP2 family protein [Sporichthya sp.]|nr:phosphatase PAP2 family protein [Sporichthya sp.]
MNVATSVVLDNDLNTDLLFTINGWSGNAAMDSAMKFAANVLIFAAFAVLAVLCGRELMARQFDRVVQTGAALALAVVLSRVAAALLPEQRPFTTHPELHPLLAHDPGQSFPSDHSLAAFGIAFAVGAFLSVRWGAGLLILALIVGFSRVYVGVHYPSDIVGSALIAALAVATVVVISRTAPFARFSPVGVRHA